MVVGSTPIIRSKKMPSDFVGGHFLNMKNHLPGERFHEDYAGEVKNNSFCYNRDAVCQLHQQAKGGHSDEPECPS